MKCQKCGVVKVKHYLFVTSKFCLCPRCFQLNLKYEIRNAKSEMDNPFVEQIAPDMNVQMSLAI